METTITNNEIIFKYFFYNVIIPKQGGIEFIFYDPRQDIGLPLILEIKSRNIKFSSFIGKTFYYLNKVSQLFIYAGNPTPIRKFYSPITIYYEKNIKTFLDDLKTNGYDVDTEIKKLKEISSQPLPAEFVPGTLEWRNDKFKMIWIIYIVIEILMAGLIFSEKKLDNSFSDFILLSILMSAICYLVFRGLNYRLNELRSSSVMYDLACRALTKNKKKSR